MTRLQMDHATPFPDGDTSATNCGGLCVKHHQQKTARHADIQDPKPDGSATWITQWGQRITIPPRPFLHDPTDHPPGPPGYPEPDSASALAAERRHNQSDDPPF